MNTYQNTVVEGIAQAKDRAKRESKPVIVYGDGKTVWVRTVDEGKPETTHHRIGFAKTTGDWEPAPGHP